MIIFDGIVKGLGYVWVGFGLGGKDDDTRLEFCDDLRHFKILIWSFRRKPPSGISVTRALPPGGVWGASPPRNLRYPCLAPAARRTDGEKSKNEPQGSYRPKNLTI